MNNIIIKEFNGTQVHTFMWNDKPCWIASDILSMFEYADPATTIGQCIDAEQFEIGVEYEILKGADLKAFKKMVNSLTKVKLVSQNTPHLVIFYEDGLYGFLQYTNKPIGIQFKKWIRREVVPEIRETGSYIGNNESQLVSIQSNGILDEYSKLNELERINKYFNLMKENQDLKEEIKKYIGYIDMFNGHIKSTTDMFRKLL